MHGPDSDERWRSSLPHPQHRSSRAGHGENHLLRCRDCHGTVPPACLQGSLQVGGVSVCVNFFFFFFGACDQNERFFFFFFFYGFVLHVYCLLLGVATSVIIYGTTYSSVNEIKLIVIHLSKRVRQSHVKCVQQFYGFFFVWWNLLILL